MQNTLAYDGQTFVQSNGRTISLPSGLSIPADQAWAFYSVTLQMGQGSRIGVRGSLNGVRLSGGPPVSFTTATPGATWHGIRYEPGATGVFTDVTVSRVDRYGEATTDPPPPVPYYGAVEVNGATFTMTRGAILNTLRGNGLMATGPSIVSLIDVSVQSSDGAGLVASGGAALAVSGPSTRVRQNRLGGIWASGYKTVVALSGSARVDENIAYGATAGAYAEIDVASLLTLPSSISGNRGGIETQSGAYFAGGYCAPGGACQPSSRYAFNALQNPCSPANPTGNCDARASGGSVITAQFAFWGGQQTEAELHLLRSGKSIIVVEPLLGSDPDGNRGGGFARGTTPPAETLASDDDSDPASERNADVTRLLAGARQAARDGERAAAFALVQQATVISANPATSDDEDRAAAYGTAAALFAASGPEADAAALVAAFEADASTESITAPWSRRALAVAQASSGNPSASDALAATLTSDADAGHRAFGFGQRIRLAVEAGRALSDSSAAVARLADFAAATDGMDDADLAVLSEATALVVAAFPGALSGGGLARGVERGLAGQPDASRGESAADTGKAEESDRVRALDVSPNPTSGVTAVRLSGGRAGERAEVILYDALGRRVSVLYDGLLPSGAMTERLDTSTLPPGVYVVRALLTRGTETEALVRRILVAR